MKPAASSASSEWMMCATLIAQPGRSSVKVSGNHMIRPLRPIIATPQKTAM